jgi:adenylate cyclase class 2
MKEIEVKILNVNKKEIEAKLKKLGAKKTFDDKVFTIAYCYPNEDAKHLDRFVRLRKLGKDIMLTVKVRLPSKKVKVRDEFEVKVSDFKIAKEILNALGLTEFKRNTKIRTSYSIGNVHFELDTYEKENTLMEIEGPNEKEILKYVRLLGYTEKDTCLFAYSENDKIKKNKRKKSLK